MDHDPQACGMLARRKMMRSMRQYPSTIHILIALYGFIHTLEVVGRQDRATIRRIAP